MKTINVKNTESNINQLEMQKKYGECTFTVKRNVISVNLIGTHPTLNSTFKIKKYLGL